MRNAGILFRKQMRDTFRNKAVLIQFLMLPALTWIMQKVIAVPDLPENFFVILFAAMFIGMAPTVAMSSVVSEEKEVNTLRFLWASGARPWQYLLGTGLAIWLCCMVGAAIMCAAGDFSPEGRAAFLGILAAGIAVSIVVGAAIGVFSRDQMMATSVAIPVMMIFSFLPMLATFNDDVKSVASVTYTEQISRFLSQMDPPQVTGELLLVLGLNLAVFTVLFVLAWKKRGLR